MNSVLQVIYTSIESVCYNHRLHHVHHIEALGLVYASIMLAMQTYVILYIQTFDPVAYK